MDTAPVRYGITGGAGFVGSRIGAALLQGGASKVVAVDNLARGCRENLAGLLKDRRFELLEGDLRDREVRRRVTEDVDVLFHLAALRIPRCQESPDDCLTLMIDATFNLFDEAARAGVERVIYASSVAVYGEPAQLPVQETEAPTPITFYGAAKMAGEHLLEAFERSTALKGTVLRYFNAYGPGMDIRSRHVEVLVRWMSAIRDEQPIRIHGDGSTTLDLTYIDDLVAANLAALQPAAAGRTYNVASGAETSLLQLAETLGAVVDRPVRIERQESEKPSTPVRMVAAVKRAFDELGHRHSVSLEDGVARTWRWFLEQTASVAPTLSPSTAGWDS